MLSYYSRRWVFPESNSYSQLNRTVLADGIFHDKWNSSENNTHINRKLHLANAYYNGTFGRNKCIFLTMDVFNMRIFIGCIYYMIFQEEI